MLWEAELRLKPGGRLFLPTGTLQDEAAIPEVVRAVYGNPEKLAERLIPFPS